MAQSRLLLMPREIRDMIYRFTFAGSRLHFGSGLMNRFCRWQVVGHVEILFACHMSYEEGRSAFWDEVIVYGYEGWPRTTIYQLSQHLGDFAKSRIRHIRHLRAVPNYDGNNTDENKLGLDQFPRLKTCEIFGCPLVYGGPNSELSNDDEQTWIDYGASRQFSGADPHRKLEEYWKLDVKQHKVQFLMGFTIVHISSFMPYTTHAKKIWVNMTTKKYFIKCRSGADIYVEEEEGFRRVFAESPQRQVTPDRPSSDLARTNNEARVEDNDCADVD
ncbi:hypothetical protein F4782DRAFT_549214 [Xylaria castorea]|nr:hypothetical protein F4782DRAFT_549214 [Xylaria castorea]